MGLDETLREREAEVAALTGVDLDIEAGEFVALDVDATLLLLPFGFAAAVGVVFGFFPARKAARMNPIDALRRE